MTDYSRKYRAKHLQNQIDIAKRLQGAMARIGDKVARLASDPQAKFVKSFDFRNNPHLNKVLTAITAELQGEVLSITEAAIATSWAISNQKNDITVNTYFEGLAGLKKKPADYLTTNSEALRAFINRKNDTGTLSDSVWKVADSFRDEMEVHLGYGIANGDSAQTISRRIREYLNNPEQLFRRVRNEAGKLGLSENAKQFHPGQGTYRSAYKNALRVSRSETNQAYLLNDHLRWNKMDFVIGVHIELSEQHPVTDICDSMQGDYPKDFVFVGFHSQCLCHATPILMPKEKFKKYLAGEPVEVNEVVDVPQGHKDWIAANKQRVEGWKSKPYFIRDNYKDGDLNKGFVFKVPKDVKIPVKSTTVPAPKPEPKIIRSVDNKYEKIANFEKSIRKNKSFETALIFDGDGNLLSKIKGGQRSVSIPNSELVKLKDSIFTHNHPSGNYYNIGDMSRIGNSFSPQDFGVAIRNDVQELRAVTPEFTFIAKRPASGWPDANEFGRAINKAHYDLQNELSRRITNGKTTIKKASVIHWHMVNRTVCEKFNVLYKKERIL